MKIQTGDKVKVISGKDKGVESTVERVFDETSKVLVKNVNVVTKHMKPSGKNSGGIIKVNRPIHVSNVMLICPKTAKPTRIGYTLVDGKKYRISNKSKEIIKKS